MNEEARVRWVRRAAGYAWHVLTEVDDAGIVTLCGRRATPIDAGGWLGPGDPPAGVRCRDCLAVRVVGARP